MSNATDTFLDAVALEIKREWFRGMVGRQMWCKVCESCLDVSRAVECTVWDAEDGSAVLVTITCAACFLEYVPRLERTIALHNERNHPGQLRMPHAGERKHQLRIEVTDGRILFPPKPRKVRAKRTKKVKAASV